MKDIFCYDYIPEDLKQGIKEFQKKICFYYDIQKIFLSFARKRSGFSIDKCGNKAIIGYNKKSDFYSALSLLTARINEDIFYVDKDSSFNLYALTDCSRNAVRKVESLKKYIFNLAGLGYSGIYLYLENIFFIKGEPYWGYQKGSYTKEEIKEVIAYADIFGMEVIPAIQSLAHLSNALRWDCYNEYKDTEDILLAEDDKVYDLLDKLFASIRELFKTKKINLGLDEAHFIGLGAYLNKHGYKSRSEIMLKHINYISKLCEKYDFDNAEMWSDMLFRLFSGGEYTANISSEFQNKIPDNISLVYWDYYTESYQDYYKMMSAHKKISEKVSFACCGGFTWFGFTPANKCAYDRIKASFKAAKDSEINRITVCQWYDNGAEGSMFSGTASLIKASSLNYDYEDNEVLINDISSILTGYSLKDWENLDTPNELYEFKDKRYLNSASKYLFYGDLIEGLFDCHVNENFNKYLDVAIKKLDSSINNNQYDYIFTNLKNLCMCLKIKINIMLNLKTYYDNKNMLALSHIVKELKMLKKRTDIFYNSLKNQWDTESKSCGFEVLDIRVGGLIKRIEHTKEILENYIFGKIDKIEELDTERIPYLVYPCYDFEPNDKNKQNFVAFNYKELCTTGTI